MVETGKTILDRINYYSLHSPHKIAYRYFEDGNTQSLVITYGELQHRAKSIAACLQNMALKNPYVLISIKSGIEFINHYIACLYANLTVIPVDVPAGHKQQAVLNLINHIYDETQFALVIADSSWKTNFKDVPIIYHSDLINTNTIDSNDNYQDDSITHIQYTSGSTSAPKGVITTHKNLTISLIQTASMWHLNENSINLVWAPHTHVYGLICGYLLPLYQGAETIIVPTEVILKNPLIWLKTMSRHKVSHSGCPNFGFDMCISQYEAKALRDLDLSHLQVAVSGGEVVRSETLRKFCELFKPYGFTSDKFFPAYGMTETTGLIASKLVGDEPRSIWLNLKNLDDYTFSRDSLDKENGETIISVGKAIPGLEVKISDLKTGEYLETGIGEVCLSGETIGTYFGVNSKSNSLFRTGDIGFLDQGDLFLIGRRKEIININGIKYSPESIEKTVRDVTDEFLEISSLLAFPAKIENKENAVLYLGYSSPLSLSIQTKLIKNIRITLANQLDIGLYDILFIAQSEIPKTNSGKISRSGCAKQFVASLYKSEHQKAHSSSYSSQSNDGKIIVEIIAEVLEVSESEISSAKNLSEFGIDSVKFIQLFDKLQKQFPEIDTSIFTPATFYEFTTVSQIIEFLDNHKKTSINKESALIKDKKDDIAIIGMAGIFPKAKNIDEYWQNMIRGRDCISEIPPDRWDWRVHSPINCGGFIEDIDKFDATFFKISPKEAMFMDPQHRLFLQTVWHAVESSGYSTSQLAHSSTGLFVGVWSNDYLELLLKNTETQAQLSTGTPHCILANRISYLLDWHGPSEAIDTACSSSLVAIRNAVTAIQNGDCELAIAGGVNALLTPSLYIAANKAGMLSIEGRCKTFDKKANGFVRAEGLGAIVLKPLKQALLDGDRIDGVIRATAVNHSGHTNSLTAPNPKAQADLLVKAYTRANIDPETVTYIEAHGTGTALGDPIEINGIKSAFKRLWTLKKEAQLPDEVSEDKGIPTCTIGSGKSNIGHLESAAGIAGVIKVLLSLQHKTIPGNIHFNTINPYINLNNSRLSLSKETKDWDICFDKNNKIIPRRAGISSFGFGGTNAHVIIEEWIDKLTENPAEKPCYLIALSAKSKVALQQKIMDLISWVKQKHTQNYALSDVFSRINA